MQTSQSPPALRNQTLASLMNSPGVQLLLGTLSDAKRVFQLSPLISPYIIFRKGSASIFGDLYRVSLGFSKYIT